MAPSPGCLCNPYPGPGSRTRDKGRGRGESFESMGLQTIREAVRFRVQWGSVHRGKSGALVPGLLGWPGLPGLLILVRCPASMAFRGGLVAVCGVKLWYRSFHGCLGVVSES
jgi:hypothetical protein